jgi:formylglycine-generating enzyme required for sulfatase activity
VIEASTDLIHWAPILATNAADWSVMWADMDAQRYPWRFYRLSLFRPPESFVWIPPGTFTLGSPDTEVDREASEGPQTEVAVTRGFWMNRYEVTQGEYFAVMGANPSAFPGDPNRPVERVSWRDATNYCARLTAQERQAGRLPAGMHYRLPTEAEWEYAARAGTSTRFSFGDDPDYAMLASYGWFGGNNNVDGPKRVGLKAPNPWGLFDMHGNVYEWCSDWLDTYAGGSATDLRGYPESVLCAARGGSYASSGRYCRSAYRYGFLQDYTDIYTGFRVVVSSETP